MSPRLSYHLDLLRFIAAFIVLLSHFAYERFTQGYYAFIRDYNLGSDAVVVFFVLSGFVISFAAIEKDKTAGRFAFSRMTRLYSVAIPALILTLFCDKLGMIIKPEMYSNVPFYAAQPMGTYWLNGLAFSTQWTGNDIRLGTNGPYWSLSYEAAYYMLFAILMFGRGIARIVMLALTVFIVGLKVLVLLPAWAMGAGIYFLLQRSKGSKRDLYIYQAMMILPFIVYILCLGVGVPQFFYILSSLLLTPEILTSLHYSNEFLWNALIGCLFSIHLLGAGLWMKSKVGKPSFRRQVKWLAGASFSLYLMHYPVLTLAKVSIPTTGLVFLDHIILLIVTIVVCFIFAEFFERPLYKFRNWIKTLLQYKSHGHKELPNI